MKKLIVLFGLLFVFGMCFAGTNPYIIGGGAISASSLDWTDCVFFMTFEAGDDTGDYDISTSNGDYSAGDTTMTYQESASLESTNEIVGSYSGYINSYGWFELAVSSGPSVPSGFLDGASNSNEGISLQ